METRALRPLPRSQQTRTYALSPPIWLPFEPILSFYYQLYTPPCEIEAERGEAEMRAEIKGSRDSEKPTCICTNHGNCLNGRKRTWDQSVNERNIRCEKSKNCRRQLTQPTNSRNQWSGSNNHARRTSLHEEGREGCVSVAEDSAQRVVVRVSDVEEKPAFLNAPTPYQAVVPLDVPIGE